MTQRQSLALLLAHASVAVLVIAAASVLAALHDLDAQAVVALFGTAIGLVGGAGASLGVSAINGGPKPDLTRLAMGEQQAASDHLARSDAALARDQARPGSATT